MVFRRGSNQASKQRFGAQGHEDRVRVEMVLKVLPEYAWMLGSQRTVFSVSDRFVGNTLLSQPAALEKRWIDVRLPESVEDAPCKRRRRQARVGL